MELNSGLPCVIKMANSEIPGAELQVCSELCALKKMQHPNIAKILDFNIGCAPDATIKETYFVSEFFINGELF